MINVWYKEHNIPRFIGADPSRAKQVELLAGQTVRMPHPSKVGGLTYPSITIFGLNYSETGLNGTDGLPLIQGYFMRASAAYPVAWEPTQACWVPDLTREVVYSDPEAEVKEHGH